MASVSCQRVCNCNRRIKTTQPSENFSKKPNSAKKKPETAKLTADRRGESQTLFAALLFLCHRETSKLDKTCGQWCHSCVLIHRQLLAPIRKSSPIHSCISTRITRALLLPRRHCRIAIAETQISLQALSLFSAYNTIHATQWTHFQRLRKNFVSKLASFNFH